MEQEPQDGKTNRELRKQVAMLRLCLALAVPGLIWGASLLSALRVGDYTSAGPILAYGIATAGGIYALTGAVIALVQG